MIGIIANFMAFSKFDSQCVQQQLDSDIDDLYLGVRRVNNIEILVTLPSK